MEGRIIKLHEPRILKIAVIIVIGLIIVTTFSAAAVDDGGWNPVENDRDGDGLTLEEEKARTKIYDEIYFTDMVSSTSPVPPDEPVLSVEDFNSGSVTISWNQVGNVMNYEIYRKETNMDREREDVINKQFNVYTVDTINPYSMELRVENIVDGGDAKGRVHMEFFDASGIAYVNITNLDQGNYKNISASELEYYDGLIILDEYIDIEGDSDYWVDGWDLGVLIVDENGNEFYEEKHVQSELGGIWQEFTEWIVEHVWRTVEEAVERTKELGNALKDWVEDKVERELVGLYNQITETKKPTINEFIGNSKIQKKIEELYKGEISLINMGVSLSSVLITNNYSRLFAITSLSMIKITSFVLPFLISNIITQTDFISMIKSSMSKATNNEFGLSENQTIGLSFVMSGALSFEISSFLKGSSILSSILGITAPASAFLMMIAQILDYVVGPGLTIYGALIMAEYVPPPF